MARLNPTAASYAAALTLCVLHPSRRAAGFCDSCGWDLCRQCLLAEHACRTAPAAPRPRRRAGAMTTAGVVLLAGFAAWLIVRNDRRVAPPEPTLTAPAPARPGITAGDAAGPGSDMEPVTTLDTLRATLGGETRADPTAGSDSVPADEAHPRVRSSVPAEAARTKQLAGNTSPDMSLAATSRRPTALSFNRGPVDRREVLLSFDGGATVEGAEDILNTLSAVGVKTTFFLTGEFIRNHPVLVRRLVNEGHEIGNHMDTHPHLTTWETNRRQRTLPTVNRAWLGAQLSTTALAFRQATGQELAPLWRAPYGEINNDILRWAQDAGWQHVGWTNSLDSLDWVSDPESAIYRSAEEIARRLVELPRTDRRGGRGAIVLMHLGSDRPHQDRMARVLPQIIAAYRELGFEFVTASAMMRDS